jgi:hypothetical protein
MIDYRKVVTVVVDLLALFVSIVVGFLAMPPGMVLGALWLGGKAFTIVWNTLGNSDLKKLDTDLKK